MSRSHQDWLYSEKTDTVRLTTKNECLSDRSQDAVNISEVLSLSEESGQVCALKIQTQRRPSLSSCGPGPAMSLPICLFGDINNSLVRGRICMLHNSSKIKLINKQQTHSHLHRFLGVRSTWFSED